MPVTIVVGGQYGSEGKGKVAHYFAKEQKATFAVRCGGSNSGHTVVDEAGCVFAFQHLPTAAILPDITLVLCAGTYVDVDILLREITTINLPSHRLIIDPDAVIITDEMKRREQNGGLIEKIGSTGSGTGAAVAARINREHSVVFAKDDERLSQYIADAPQVLRGALDRGQRIVIEGTQGFALSPLHSRHYPKVTSRDTIASAFLAEAGLSPFDVDDVVLVLRAFPIRVAGDSGPLPHEISWDIIKDEGQHSLDLTEFTTVTKKIRRVARFCPEVVKQAITINRPSKIVLNHLDYISSSLDKDAITQFIREVESNINCSIDFIGLGQNQTYNIKHF